MFYDTLQNLAIVIISLNINLTLEWDCYVFKYLYLNTFLNKGYFKLPSNKNFGMVLENDESTTIQKFGLLNTYVENSFIWASDKNDSKHLNYDYYLRCNIAFCNWSSRFHYL